MQQLVIRPATASDRRAITRLFEATWAHDQYPSTPRTRRMVGPFIFQTPMTYQEIACASSAVVGHAAISPASAHEYSTHFATAMGLAPEEISVLCRLATHPKWRRLGIAEMLVRSIQTDRRIAFESLAERTTTTEFYTRLGFHQIGEVYDTSQPSRRKILWVDQPGR